jgi:oligopeptide transport system substrate-binding protein
MMLKKVSSQLIRLLGFIILLCACSDNQSEKHPQDTLRIDVSSEAPTLDPQLQQDTSSARIAYDLFAGLVDFDQQNNPIPGMADHWLISPDAKTVTFYLRHNLKFSDGSPISANDFVYSWKRLINPETASAYAYLLDHVVNGKAIAQGKMSPEKLGVSAPDNNTFVVKLVEPDNTLMAKCTMPNLAAVSSKSIQQYGPHWTDAGKMVTSGAYRLKEHVVYGYIQAEKNPYYYDADQIHIPTVKYFPYEDTNAAVASYESGGLDLTGDSLPVNRYKTLLREYPAQLHTVQQEGTYYYAFNMTLPEFKDIRVRQALSMAMDRDIISQFILPSHPKPLYSVVTSTIANGEYADIQYPWAHESRQQQIAEAQRLYHEAGYGPQHPLKLSISFNTNDGHQKIALAVASMWKTVLGVETTIQNQEWKTFIDARQQGDFMIARDGWIADYNSVTAYLMLYACDNPQNHSRYCDNRYDQLITQGDAELDSETQKKYYHQALQIALDDYTIIPMYQYNYVRLVKPYIKGYDIEHNYLNHVQSKWMRFTKE